MTISDMASLLFQGLGAAGSVRRVWFEDERVCGIAGVLLRDASESRVSEEKLREMTQTLRHRGPDQLGLLVREKAGLGVRRLIVLDPVGGNQPVTDATNRVHLAYNGELYNHRELRAELESSGVRFRSNCDSEVVLAAFLSRGPRCVESFNGMYAFAVLDERGEQPSLFLARDRLGIKPLYYSIDDRRVLFGSEPSALFAYDPSLARDVDPVALDQYLSFEYVPAPRTLHRRVRKLEPGHRLLVASDPAPDSEPYWDLTREPVEESPAEPLERELLVLLEDAVERRLMSDVPLGVFLSGGVDSGAIAALATRARNGEAIQTFCLKFRQSSYDESRFAAEVARSLGTRHTEIEMPEPSPGLLAEILPFLSDPIADTSLLPTYALCRGARQSVTVALAGDGGDELFAGYETYRAQALARWLALVPSSSLRGLHAFLSRWVKVSEEKKGVRNSLLRFFEGWQHPRSLGHFRWACYLHRKHREELYDRDRWEELREVDPGAPLLAALRRGRTGDALDRALAGDLTTWLPDDILSKVDRASMGCSLEVRVPFLDHRVVQRVSRIPSRLKMRGLSTKILLKRSFRGRLPATILERGKQGFSSPVKVWLRREFRPLMADLLDHSEFFARWGLKRSTVARWTQEHGDGRENHAHRLWPLLILHLVETRTWPGSS